MTAYYNEIDPAAAHVLRTLIDDGVIAPGVVDTRSIKEVAADDLKGFTQCHFFAGGGLWSVAARLAGWPDARPIWTASCPCQPFSVAGKGAGVDDERHLWPDVDRLLGEARARGFGPPVLVGEQVAGKAGYHWFHGVRADLALQGYRARVVDIPACAVDAPHIRQRQYWCAVANGGYESRGTGPDNTENGIVRADLYGEGTGRFSLGHGDGEGLALRAGERSVSRQTRCTPAREVFGRSTDQNTRHLGDTGDGAGDGREQGFSPTSIARHGGQPATAYGRNGLHADAHGGGCAGRQESALGQEGERAAPEWDLPRRNGSYWADAEWIICHDGKARRTKPGLRLLVDGIPRRVDLWRIAGNAIVPEAAAQVIGALIDVLPECRAVA